jgi:1,4-alpha-glucan branching enzyme
VRAVRFPVFLLLAGCSLTPIPDVSSKWSPDCAEAERLCEKPFSLAYANQTSVELRGNFKPGAWQQGVPMTRDAGAWEAVVTVGWGADVQYKFYVDGTTWQTDPTNTATVPDGNGNTNSIERGVTCEQWTCDGGL